MTHRPRIPKPTSSFVGQHAGQISRDWWRFLHDLWKQIGIEAFEVIVKQSEVSSASERILVDAAAGEQWKVRDIILSNDGNSFSGGGGDRDLSITDGTTTWSVIPAATLQNLAVSRWGIDAGMPNPENPPHLFAASASGTDIMAKYSGGTTDYTVGQCTIMLLAERTA